MSLTEDIANDLADQVMAHVRDTGDEEAIVLMSKALGDTSQTLQEAFISAIRTRKAEQRARAVLAERMGVELPPPTPTRAPDAVGAPDAAEAPAPKKKLVEGPWDLPEKPAK